MGTKYIHPTTHTNNIHPFVFFVPLDNEGFTTYAQLYMPRTDRELLMACREGDESSWEALVDRYQRLIYAIPRRAGLSEDQAGEVFQEVFTTLLKKLNDITDLNVCTPGSLPRLVGRPAADVERTTAALGFSE